MTDDVDTAVAEVARELLDGPLDEFVARRKAAAHRLRGQGRRDDAEAVQSLTKPTLVVYAVLRAADDPAAVVAAVDATTELARVQAGGGDREELGAATSARREQLDALVDAGLAAGASGGDVPAGRAEEVRTAIDLLTRHEELLDAWTAGTLRDLPEHDGGLGAFGLPSSAAGVGGSGTARSGADGGRQPRPRRAGTTERRGSTRTAEEARRPLRAQRRAREQAQKAIARAEADRQGADAALEAAHDEATAAGQALRSARRTLAGAEKADEKARRAVEAAEERRDRAGDELDRAQAALDELDES